jgi:hypothetical protein
MTNLKEYVSVYVCPYTNKIIEVLFTYIRDSGRNQIGLRKISGYQV